MSFPYVTGADVPAKATTFDVSANTSNFINGADWNLLRGYVNAMQRWIVGGERFFCERRGTSLTAVTVHTGTVMENGRRKTIASARVLMPGTTGTTWVWGRANVGATPGQIVTGAAEPTVYATTTLDFPIAKVVRTGGTVTITHVRPDWILANRQV